MGSDTNVDRAIYDLLLAQCPAMWLGFPIGNGRVYFVDGLTGNNANVGTRPSLPWLTIAYALTQCTNGRNDYIIVLDHWQEAMPIAINRTRVHILGLSSNPSNPYVRLNAAGNNTAIFTVSALSHDCEIAGFSFGAGAAHAAIEDLATAPRGLYIHDCQFGHDWACGGNTPRDGINIAVNAIAIRIVRNKFLGTVACGETTRDGIHWDGGAADPFNGNIDDNEFLGLPTVGINIIAVLPGGAITIRDNIFACGADVAGCAITLGATCWGFLVVGNKALYGDVTAAMINNPYLDSAVAFNNHWMANYKGNALIDPA